MPTNSPVIAIVEDDAAIRLVVRLALKSAGFTRVVCAGRGDEALELMRSSRADAAILDIMLPGMDGIAICRQMRKDPALKSIPAIMLTAKGEERDIVAGLDAGADDYVTKPFSAAVLIARLKAVLRRPARSSGALRVLDGLELDTISRVCRLDGEAVSLTPSEYGILALLMDSPNRVWTRSQIIDKVQGEEKAVTDRTVDVQLVGLRRKLGAWARHIEAVRGVGYRLTA